VVRKALTSRRAFICDLVIDMASFGKAIIHSAATELKMKRSERYLMAFYLNLVMQIRSDLPNKGSELHLIVAYLAQDVMCMAIAPVQHEKA
jgi:hypothetical protein